MSITQVRADLIAAIQSILGPSVKVHDQTVREIEREKLKGVNCIVGPEEVTKERLSRTHVDNRYQFIIAMLRSLKEDPMGRSTQEAADALGKALLALKKLPSATIMEYTPEDFGDDDQYRNAGQITSALRLECRTSG